jgi:hypothetical protein
MRWLAFSRGERHTGYMAQPTRWDERLRGTQSRKTRRLQYKARRKELRRARIVAEQNRRHQRAGEAEMREAAGRVA